MQKNRKNVFKYKQTSFAFLIILFLLSIFALIAIYLFLPKLPQPQSYHQFAGLHPRVENILSSLVFIPLGIWGIRIARFLDRREGRFLWIVFFVTIVFVGLSSAYYHENPMDLRLMVDRLSITVALMAFISILIGEEIGAVWGIRLFFPLATLGIFSVIEWI